MEEDNIRLLRVLDVYPPSVGNVFGPELIGVKETLWLW